MRSMLSALNGRWIALPPRTRTLAIGAATLLAAFILYSAVWRPLQKDLQSLRTSVPNQAEQLEWMRTQAPIAKGLKAKNFSNSDNIMQTVEQTAVTQGVRPYINRIDTEGTASVRVTLENVPFNTMVSWLSDLHTNFGTMVDDATIESRPTSGVVNARIRLRTGGA